MVTVMSNSGVGVSKKTFFEKMADSFLAVNISGSPAVGEDGRQPKSIFFN